MAGNLLGELKRRQVFKAGAAYLIVAWLAVQGASIGFPAFEAPPWALRVFILVALLGFPVTLVMAWVFERTPEGLQIDPAQTGTKRIVAVAVLLGVLAWVWYWKGQPAIQEEIARAAEEPGYSAPPVAPKVDPKSIAVLAFADLSPTHDQEYFSDGMAEEILNALAQVKGLTVAGRTSSFSYKGKNVDLRDIGKQLGVAHVLEGSVRKQGEQVRITAQLIRTDNGTHLWSKAFDGDLKNVFKLQEDVARAITDELQIVLAEGQQLVPVATRNPEAYALYLKATSTFDRRDPAHMAEAARQLEQAVKLDPGYARAWSRLSAVYAILPTYIGTDTATMQPKLTAAARRAIELDPTLAEPWAVQGLAAGQGNTDQLAARAFFDKALAIDPDDITTNFWFGLNLLRCGYEKQGVERIDHALAIDPMVPNVMRWRGVVYLRDGDFDNAEQFLKRAQAAGLGISGRELAELAARRGDREEAARQWRQGTGVLIRLLPPADADAIVAGLYGGNEAERARAIATLEDYADKREFVSGLVPLMLAQLGRGAQALDIAHRKVTGDDSDFMVYLFSPAGAPMRALPEYQAFVKAEGFPALWAKYGPPDFEQGK
jgi:TolB-like protein/Tfp pilus assembly protein PilF